MEVQIWRGGGGKEFWTFQKLRFSTSIIFLIFWTGGKNSSDYLEKTYGNICWYFCSSVATILEYCCKFDRKDFYCIVMYLVGLVSTRSLIRAMYKKGTGNDKQGKNAGNRTLRPAIMSCFSRPCEYTQPDTAFVREMYKTGTGNNKQGKDTGNRTLRPAIMSCFSRPCEYTQPDTAFVRAMYKKGTGNDKQGKDVGNRTLRLAIMSCFFQAL